jgi:aminobenzoyl-glutamate utilization protein A
MGREVYDLATASGKFAEVVPKVNLGASEDCSYFMERVQQQGGKAVYMMFGSVLKAGHHNSAFDFNEDCLPKSVAFLTVLARHFAAK